MYKDKIYDITALEMFKRLEVFLNEMLEDEIGRAKKESPKKFPEGLSTVQKKIEKFKGKYENCGEIADAMGEIRKKRNDIFHPKDLAELIDFSPLPRGVLGLKEFKGFQKKCFDLDKKIEEKFHKKLRIKEIMIPTLKYDMGNAGDIIKHGLLAEFVEWYKTGHDCLRFADPFGGCPWSNLPRGGNVHKRLGFLKKTALGGVYFPNNGEELDKYLGSSHLVRKAAENCSLKAEIDVSDNDENARCNLENSIQEYKCMRLVELPNKNNGYKILENDNVFENSAPKYDLILIDPYSDFLRDEFYFYAQKQTHYFARINELAKNLFIAVFVLDMNKKNRVGRNFAEFKKNKLTGRAVSIRCPKIKEKGDGYVKGESTFDSEILLVREGISGNKFKKLHERLKNFADKATEALPLRGNRVEFWDGN